MICVETHGLTRDFGGQAAVDGVGLSVRTGEIRCLIGPNGAGKSTVLALLAGNLVPSSRKIRLNGHDITAEPPYLRAQQGLSLKFQIPNVFPELSVRQNLKIALARKHSGSGLDAEIESALRLLDLIHRQNDPARMLSHGQKQWLELGLAVAIRPSLLLLDEPTAGMTTEETEKTGRLIVEMNKSGVTVIAVEHDMQFVRQIAHTVSVLHLGRIFFEGTIDSVLRNEAVTDIYFGRAA